jgi:hypothetical protein
MSSLIDCLMPSDDFDDASGDDEDVGGGYGDGVDGGPIDGGSDDSSDDELDVGDFLSKLLHQTKAELLVGSAKGLANFATMKKSAEENIYERSNGHPKNWIVVRFILGLLSLKAKHN